MIDQSISLVTAKLLKETIKTFGGADYYYVNAYLGEPDSKWKLVERDKVDFSTKLIPNYSAPTQTALQKYLREVRGIIVLVQEYNEESPGNYYFIPQIVLKRNLKFKENSESIQKLNDIFKNVLIYNTNDNESYELALELGLQEGLRLIKLWKTK